MLTFFVFVIYLLIRVDMHVVIYTNLTEYLLSPLRAAVARNFPPIFVCLVVLSPSVLLFLGQVSFCHHLGKRQWIQKVAANLLKISN